MARTIEKWIEINAPLERVFGLFAELENLPRWITVVRDVEPLGARRALLRTAGSAAPETLVDWEAQVTEADPPRRVAWRAAGRGASAEVGAELEDTQRGTTLLRVLLTEHAAGSGVGLFGADPASELEGSLGRFKQIAEGYDEDATLVARPGKSAAVVPGTEGVESVPLNPAAPRFVAPDVRPVTRARGESDSPRAATAEPTRGAEGRRDFNAAPPRFVDRRRRAPYIYAGLAALLALALGALLWNATRGREGQRVAGRAATPEATATAPQVGDVQGATPTTPDANDPPNATPAPTIAPANPSGDSDDGAMEETPADSPAESAPRENQQASLKTALADWVAATNSQDIGKQMAFYAPVVEHYYLRKNFSRRAVSEDKTRLAERASLVNITVGEPEVTFDREGRRAVMRFRKQYSIEGSQLSRGEVVQELKWAKTGEDWKIVSERDVRVIR